MKKYMIVQTELNRASTLLHFLASESVAQKIFDAEAEKLSADHGLYLFKIVKPLRLRASWEMAEAMARSYGASLRAGVLRIEASQLGPRYAFRESLKESA